MIVLIYHCHYCIKWKYVSHCLLFTFSPQLKWKLNKTGGKKKSLYDIERIYIQAHWLCFFHSVHVWYGSITFSHVYLLFACRALVSCHCIVHTHMSLHSHLFVIAFVAYFTLPWHLSRMGFFVVLYKFPCAGEFGCAKCAWLGAGHNFFTWCCAGGIRKDFNQFVLLLIALYHHNTKFSDQSK